MLLIRCKNSLSHTDVPQKYCNFVAKYKIIADNSSFKAIAMNIVIITTKELSKKNL